MHFALLTLQLTNYLRLCSSWQQQSISDSPLLAGDVLTISSVLHSWSPLVGSRYWKSGLLRWDGIKVRVRRGNRLGRCGREPLPSPQRAICICLPASMLLNGKSIRMCGIIMVITSEEWDRKMEKRKIKVTKVSMAAVRVCHMAATAMDLHCNSESVTSAWGAV